MSFFDHIYGSAQQGGAFLITIGPDGQLDSQSAPQRWPSSNAYLERMREVRSYEDVYYSVCLFSGEHRVSTDENATASVVWADADICPPEAFRLPPSIIVQTSPAHPLSDVCEERDRTGKPCNGHYHVLWELDKPYPAQEVEQVSRRLSYAHYDEGCDRGWTMTKILRVPGTSNTRHNPPYLIPEPEYSGRKFTLDEIREAYADVSVDEIVRGVEGDAPEPVDPQRLAELENLLAANQLENLYLLKPSPGESWSERQYRLELELFRLGLTDQEVFSVALNSASNKYNPENAGEETQSGLTIPRRRDPEGVLWREVQKAKREFETEVVFPTSPREFTSTSTLSFLTDDERELLDDNPTIIDQYVQWALTKSPDHAATFSKSLVWAVLASCYGNKANIRYSWGNKQLNFWMYLLAGSTKDHKSTAINLMKNVVRGVEKQTQEKVLISADFTAEGLTQALSTRDGEVTTIVQDEMQGFFKELVTKQYRSGTMERLNQFYDGSVPQVIRSTKGAGTDNETTTVFNFVGGGIFDQTARTLRIENFESGFLFRSVWSIADAQPYAQGDSDLPTTFVESDYSDQTYRDMVKALRKNMTRYDKDKPQLLNVSREATSRLNALSHMLQEYARSVHGEHSPLSRGIDRLRDTIAVCAALLSYHHKLDEVGDFEMMVAIRQAELWFHDMQRMLAAVSNSDFGRSCDDVEVFIASGNHGTRANSEIYRKFNLKPAEYNEITTSLRMQGRIRQVKDQPGKWEVLA